LKGSEKLSYSNKHYIPLGVTIFKVRDLTFHFIHLSCL